MEDKDILDLLSASKDWALEEIRAKYGSLLYEAAFFVLRDAAEAGEVSEKACVSVWKNGLYSPDRSLKYVLVRTARNLAYARKMNWNENYALADDYDSTGGMSKEIAPLPEQDQALLVAKYFYCMTEEEIAAKYKMSVENVRIEMLRLEGKFAGRNLYEDITTVNDYYLNLCDEGRFKRKPDRVRLRLVRKIAVIAAVVLVLALVIKAVIPGKNEDSGGGKTAKITGKVTGKTTPVPSITDKGKITLTATPTPKRERTATETPTPTPEPYQYYQSTDLKGFLAGALVCKNKTGIENSYEILERLNVSYYMSQATYFYWDTEYWVGGGSSFGYNLRGTDYLLGGYGTDKGLTVYCGKNSWFFPGYTFMVKSNGAEAYIVMLNLVDPEKNTEYNDFLPFYTVYKENKDDGVDIETVDYAEEDRSVFLMVTDRLPAIRVDFIKLNIIDCEVKYTKSVFGSFDTAFVYEDSMELMLDPDGENGEINTRVSWDYESGEIQTYTGIGSTIEEIAYMQ